MSGICMTVSPRKWKLSKTMFLEKGLLILLAALLLAGMVCGALAARYADESILGKLDILFASNYKTRAIQPIGTTFAASLASSFLFILATMMMGLSMWGVVLVPVIPFFRGFGLGLSAGYLYASFGWTGVLFHLSVMLPGMFLSAIAIILSAREAIRFSRRLAVTGFARRKKEPTMPDLHLYLVRNGLILGIGVLAALLDMLLTVSFAGLFSF